MQSYTRTHLLGSTLLAPKANVAELYIWSRPFSLPSSKYLVSMEQVFITDICKTIYSIRFSWKQRLLEMHLCYFYASRLIHCWWRCLSYQMLLCEVTAKHYYPFAHYFALFFVLFPIIEFLLHSFVIFPFIAFFYHIFILAILILFVHFIHSFIYSSIIFCSNFSERFRFYLFIPFFIRSFLVLTPWNDASIIYYFLYPSVHCLS